MRPSVFQETFNNTDLPKVYDRNWGRFTDLTPQQIAAFEAFPEDLDQYIRVVRYRTEIAGITLPALPNTPAGIRLDTSIASQGKIAALKQALDNGSVSIPEGKTFPFLAANGVYQLTTPDLNALYGYLLRYVQSTYVIAGELLSQVYATPQMLTTRAPVDVAFAAIAVA